MRDKVVDSEFIISGNCTLFACRCCHTKYGFEHQEWCEAYRLICPNCRDCLYYDERKNECKHPVTKKEEGGFAV